MTLIAPSTDLYLLKLPIELNDENQLTFASQTAQANYFQSLEKIGETDFTYQRRENAIRYPAQIDSIIQFNYVMYKNDAYSNKWFYARIRNMQYVNDGMTLIEIEEDTFQTWQFDIDYTQCFVEREHVMDDGLGKHTVPEDLDTGEYVVNSVTNALDSTGSTFHGGSTASLFIIMGVTQAPSGDNVSAGLPSSRMYDGLFQGLYFIAFDSISAVENVIKMYDTAGQSEAIYCIFTAPRSLVGASVWTAPHTWTYTKGGTTITATIYHINTSQGGMTNTYLENKICSPNYRVVDYGTSNEHRVYNLDGYEFKNNKMLTYPFAFFYATNNAGSDAVYRYEDFAVGHITESNVEIISARFNVYGSLSVNAQTRLVPCNYKNLLTSGQTVPNYTYGLAGQKFPASSWKSDYFTNWITQNGVNIATNLISAGVSTFAGLITGGVGTAMGAINAGATIAQTLGQIHNAQITPDQAKGDLSCGDINYSTGKTGFAIQAMSVRAEVAKIIDDYLSAYGYKVNTIKTPAITGRQNWNYIKTIGAAFHGNMPQLACDHINRMFDRGLTLWHNPSTFRNYDMPNGIVS